VIRGHNLRAHCACGSKLDRFPLHDAAGIFLCFTCHSCVTETRARYRPEIFQLGTPYAATGDETDLWEIIENEERLAP
jgi:hypothetical protein